MTAWKLIRITAEQYDFLNQIKAHHRETMSEAVGRLIHVLKTKEGGSESIDTINGH